MPSKESIAIKQKLTAEGFHHKWEDAKAIRQYIATMPPYPALTGEQEGFEMRSFQSESGLSMNYYISHGARDKGTVLYLHGGAYIEEILPPHFAFVKQWTKLTGLSIYMPNYPTVPSIEAGDLTELMREYYKFVCSKAQSPVLLMGDSAGGALALNVAQGFKGTPLTPKRLILIAPWVDVAMDNPQIANLGIPQRDVFLQPAGLGAVGRMYAGNLPMDDPAVSPLFGDMKNLPSTVILIGTDDSLLPDARLLRDRLDVEGVDTEYWEYEYMMHVWPLFPMPEAEEALDRLQRLIIRDLEYDEMDGKLKDQLDGQN
ncbi:alpha/beta hydrolase [Paenibacillus glucanolyticus]|uniref:alpha/beta hydrolase fold domain-containing protein n=1 Tax=Paenibacillus TaxID=44249 RepID=UPI0003E2745D|nr:MULTISPECIES: alpha/beta hydrolase [Paenibacillus]ANA81844.1 alpha/beta hydrolase [Paenibacillus glucanolyticus]AVV59423.1 alpha/beta hydrolase [Paenibacillus glucanolyticus]ETT43264.1 alpha/beta hydrolase fold-3 domain-containing protein [Paenibacillus sp. FSL R5-808]MPY16046.1 alpha/beta hydrolase [Paenibacillus glucanolyticus]